MERILPEAQRPELVVLAVAGDQPITPLRREPQEHRAKDMLAGLAHPQRRGMLLEAGEAREA